MGEKKKATPHNGMAYKNADSSILIPDSYLLLLKFDLGKVNAVMINRIGGRQ